MVEARPWCVPAWGEVAARRVVGACGGCGRTGGGGGGRMRDRMKVLMVFFLHFILFSSRETSRHRGTYVHTVGSTTNQGR
jgi:hypothetical protein